MSITKDITNRKDERLLVLAIDVDNDLYRKTRISGPLTGRAQILDAAKTLALADPQDPDSNNMFYAVKFYDNLKEEGYTVSVATVTGSEVEGFNADREVARQLDMVLARNKCDSCILVTDGASDQRIIPIIQSKIKISSVQVVTLKQAENLENTYFTIIEKLKEPHYSRIFFGLPAVLLLLFAISYFLGAGWIPPVGLIGIYLLIKGFGLEDMFINSFKNLGFSVDRISFAFYLSSILFIIAGFLISYENYLSEFGATGNQGISIASAVEGFLIALPIALILYLIGRIIDVKASRHFFRTFKYGIYMGSSIILWALLYSFTEWLNGQIYFGQLLEYVIFAIIVGVAVSYTSRFLRRKSLASKKLKNKIVVNELGALIGRISRADARKGKMMINTSFGNLITYSVDRITDISEKVVVN
jgi:putative membrane protein